MGKYNLYKISNKTKDELTKISYNYNCKKYTYSEQQALNIMLKMIYKTLKNINNCKEKGGILK